MYKFLKKVLKPKEFNDHAEIFWCVFGGILNLSVLIRYGSYGTKNTLRSIGTLTVI